MRRPRFRRHHPPRVSPPPAPVARISDDVVLLARMARTSWQPLEGDPTGEPAGCWASVWSDRRRDFADCGRDPVDGRGACARHTALLDEREAS